MIATRQLQFIGKIVREEDSSNPKQLLFAWVNNKRRSGRPLTSNKISIVKSLQLLYPDDTIEDIIGNVIVIQTNMDKVGSLKYWLADALNKKKWQWLIDSRLRCPHRNIPEPTNLNEPPPNPTDDSIPPTPPRRSNQRPPPSPRPQNPLPSPPRNNRNRNYDPNGVSHNLKDSFAILGYSLEEGYPATERKIRRRYIELARKFHPDKNNPSESGRNHEEATQYFQLLNNAQVYLPDWI
jgi:hypothetical protein